MKYLLAKVTGEKVMEAGTNEPIGFDSLADVREWIEEHLLIYGLDWRVGFVFKAKGEEPMKIIVRKTGKDLKA